MEDYSHSLDRTIIDDLGNIKVVEGYLTDKFGERYSQETIKILTNQKHGKGIHTSSTSCDSRTRSAA